VIWKVIKIITSTKFKQNEEKKCFHIIKVSKENIREIKK
jgi:hypothetical protein